MDVTVERLFHERPVGAVREFELELQTSLADKKRQLRETVGESYRDLISSADTIIDISRSCQHLVELTEDLQRGLGKLAGGVAGRAVAPPTTTYDRLYSLGSRIKYLLDTPETIYGCLDGGEFLAASRRYIRAAEVHRLLTAGQAKQVAQRFPMLQHQWPLVKKFRSQVYTTAGSWLGSHGELTAQQAASTLAAQALLKPADGAEVLKGFLTARQAYIMQCLSAATTDTDLDSLAFILADVATMVCATLAQCGELFLQLPGLAVRPLLAQALSWADSSSADLLFDTGKEADAWKAHVEATKNRLTELSAAGLALECSGWLDQLSQQLRQIGGRLMGPCSTVQSLLQIDAAVRAALMDWRYQLQASRLIAPAAGNAMEEAAVMSWGDICQWVLGRPTPLWPLMFEQPLLERTKQLVSLEFSVAMDQVEGLLGNALQEAACLPPSSPGTFQTCSYFEAVALHPATPDSASIASAGGSKRQRLARQDKQSFAQAYNTQSHLEQQWLRHASSIVQHFDEQLNRALVATLEACADAGETAHKGQKASGPTEAAAIRALVLEPFVQDRCVEAVEGIVASLEDRLSALPDAEDTASSPVATQALLLGRVALRLASRTGMLPVVLGPPDLWRASISRIMDADVAGRLSVLGSLSATLAPSARYEHLHQRLHSVGLQGYNRWARWASLGLASALVAGLEADQTLTSDVPLRYWSETVIGDTKTELPLVVETDVSGLEMRFQLPATPLPATMLLSLAACQEVDRAGGHLLEDEPLQLFLWNLGGSMLAALSAALGQAGPHVDIADMGVPEPSAPSSGKSEALGSKLSEKGVVQLLFDVRFLLDLLGGGRSIGTSELDTDGNASALAGRRREVMQLEAQLSDRLDPIDWATYEPYLYANKDQAALLCKVLFGVLLRNSRRVGQQAGPGRAESGSSMSSDSNILQMAAVGHRFSYLPVTSPASLLRQTSTPQMQNESMKLASADLPLALGSSTALPDVAVGKSATVYSFASLLSSKPRQAGEEDDEPSASSTSSAAKAGVSAAANKLVGLLGDSGLLSSFARGFNN